MYSPISTPWYNVPARRFPAKTWLEDRFSFRIFTPPPARPQDGPARRRRHKDGPAGSWGYKERRPFPAQVWLATRRAGG